MKNLIYIMLLSMLASCVSAGVKEHTLLPAIESAWDGVQEDIVYGESVPIEVVNEWTMMVMTGELLDMDTGDVEDAAIIGVDKRLEDGQIGPLGAEVMRDRARNFADAVDEYIASWYALAEQLRERPTVISRSSWATSPPPAIAMGVWR